MMSIFASMAQLLPVVFEVEHFSIDLYYVVNLLLFLNDFNLFGFYKYPILLSYGGVIVFISFYFLFESFLTIKKVKKLNFYQVLF